MFTSIKNWIREVQVSDVTRRRRVLIWLVGVFFVLICGIWFVTIQLGFIDWNGDWISGTRTYDASGTRESSGPDTSPIGEKWEDAKNAVGNAFHNIGGLFESTTTPRESTASSTPTSSVLTDVGTTTLSTTSSSSSSTSTP